MGGVCELEGFLGELLYVGEFEAVRTFDAADGLGYVFVGTAADEDGLNPGLEAHEFGEEGAG